MWTLESVLKLFTISNLYTGFSDLSLYLIKKYSTFGEIKMLVQFLVRKQVELNSDTKLYQCYIYHHKPKYFNRWKTPFKTWTLHICKIDLVKANLRVLAIYSCVFPHTRKHGKSSLEAKLTLLSNHQRNMCCI